MRRRRPAARARRAGAQFTLWRLELACGHTAFAFPAEKRLSFFCHAHGAFAKVLTASAMTGVRDTRRRGQPRKIAADLD